MPSIFVHARRKRNAIDRSMLLTAAKFSAVWPPSWRCSASRRDAATARICVRMKPVVSQRSQSKSSLVGALVDAISPPYFSELKPTTRKTRTVKSYFHRICTHGRTPARGRVMLSKDCDDARSASAFGMLEPMHLISSRGGRGWAASSNDTTAHLGLALSRHRSSIRTHISTCRFGTSTSVPAPNSGAYRRFGCDGPTLMDLHWCWVEDR
jgi:hypothetical protein